MGGEDLAGRGVGHQQLAARGAVGALALDGGAVRQARAAVAGPDDQLGLAGLVHGRQGGLVLVGGDADGGLHGAGRLGGGLVGGDLRAEARQGDLRAGGLVHGGGRAVRLLVHHQVSTQDREPGEGALVAEVAGAVGVHHGVLGHQLLLAAQGQGVGQLAGLAVRQGEQVGEPVAGPGVRDGVRHGRAAHLDDTGEQGGGGEYGDCGELSLHGRVLPGNRVWARSHLVPGAGVGT